MSIVSENDFFESKDFFRTQHTGIVVSNDDPKKIGRVKVYIRGIYDNYDSVSDLPWCRPLYPCCSGGSPDNVEFSVPSVGSDLQVVFKTNDYYNPIYINTRLLENYSIKDVFGVDYPNVSGRIYPSGEIKRRNNSEKWVEYYHPSGFFDLKTIQGDYSLNIPGNLNISINGLLNIIEKSEFNGGFGDLIFDLSNSLVNGPHMSGILEIISSLPSLSSSQPYSDVIMNFNQYCKNISKLFEDLSSLLKPDFSNLQEMLNALANKTETIKYFNSLGGSLGISEKVFNSFGVFGIWSSLWLSNSETILDKAINSLNSEYLFKEALKTNTYVGIEDEFDFNKVKDNISRLLSSAKAITNFSEICMFFRFIKEHIDNTGYSNPTLLLLSLPNVLKNYFMLELFKIINKIFNDTSFLGSDYQVRFLSNLNLYSILTLKCSSIRYISKAILELSGQFLSNKSLADNSDIVSFFIRQNIIEVSDRIEQLKSNSNGKNWPPEIVNVIIKKIMDGIDGVFEDDGKEHYVIGLSKLVVFLKGKFPTSKIMDFIRELEFNKPINNLSMSNNIYLSAESVIDFINALIELKNGSYDEQSLSADLVAAGFGELAGTGQNAINIEMKHLQYLGKAIGTCCKSTQTYKYVEAILPENVIETLTKYLPDKQESESSSEEYVTKVLRTVAYLFGRIYLWFNDISNIDGISEDISEKIKFSKMNIFVSGLDPNSMIQSGVLIEYIIYVIDFMSSECKVYSNNIYPYGSSINQLLSSGIPISWITSKDEVFYNTVKFINESRYGVLYEEDVDSLPFKDFKNGYIVPECYYMSDLFGEMSSLNSQFNSKRRQRELEFLSNRVLSSGSSYKNSNLNTVDQQRS